MKLGDMKKIKGIFFDVESTLRVREEDAPHQERARQRMAELAEWPDVRALAGLVEERYRSYRAWASAERQEAGDFELWSKWLLPEMDRERLAAVCHELTYQYRQTKGRYRAASGGLRAVRRLYERGFRLGILSNLIGEEEIPEWLLENGLSQYFDTVALSSRRGIRMPDPEFYRLGCEELGLEPPECAYVAGGPGWDPVGPGEAGIGASVLLTGPEESAAGAAPEHIIYQLQDLLELSVFQNA